MSAKDNDENGYFYRDSHTLDPFFYYYYGDTYEIETFSAWEDTDEAIVKLNQAFLVISIILAIADFLLLLTVMFSTARKQSASWYMYHLNAVTVLTIAFSLPRMEEETHDSFGSCMFFSFAEWTLALVYSTNQIVMNVEILATVIAPHPKWNSNKLLRFFISMNVCWVVCILFSVFVKFFGHKEDIHIPVCFHENYTAQILGHLFRIWFPSIIILVEVITGVCLFVRAKSNPSIRLELADNQERSATVHEWFALFIVWNVLNLACTILVVIMHEGFFNMKFVVSIGLQMVAFLLQIGLPLCCLILTDIRDVCRRAIVVVTDIITGRRQLSSISDTRVLTMESGE